ncbi:MAG: hypothetical protein IKL25_00975 [Clostridia bacterium]|nr:hypothetical protein [Clostridia bacterium]
MLHRLICLLLLACLLTPCVQAEEPWPQPYTGDLVGTWGFCGGAEEHGDGFRLNPDGTGVCLEIVDYEQVPPQYRDTEYTFTWRVEFTTSKTYLHEIYADGRTFTYEIESYGDVRIHIPNHISGGFYYPVLNEEACAYLSGKAEHSAFDGMMMDCLDGSITGKIEATGLWVGEIFLQKEQGMWQIAFNVYDDAKDVEARFLLREDEWRVWVDEYVWLWGDFDLGQPWPAARTAEDAYARLPGILESYLTWEYAPVPTAEPAAPVIPELRSQIGKFPRNQRYEVYEGPRQQHRRAGSGKATVSTNGTIWVYGTWMGRMMIEYALDDDRHRIGWIDTDQLPASALEGVPELPFPDNGFPEDWTYGVVTGATGLYEDPLHARSGICGILPGTSVRVFAKLGSWYLVEGFVGEKLRMGFMPETSLGLAHGYAANPEWTIGRCTRYTETDIYDAFDALAQFIYHQWPGTGLMAVRYDEDDADEANPNPWWQDETGTKEGILLLADLSSMELHDYEIAGAFARDYIFILYREPGGEWVVANWGYT